MRIPGLAPCKGLAVGARFVQRADTCPTKMKWQELQVKVVGIEDLRPTVVRKPQSQQAVRLARCGNMTCANDADKSELGPARDSSTTRCCANSRSWRTPADLQLASTFRFHKRVLYLVRE